MGSVIINSSGSITMKEVWLTIVAARHLDVGCNKSNPVAEDTALIKGTDRGNFVSAVYPGDQEDEFSPIGDQINGVMDQDGLAPWIHSGVTMPYLRRAPSSRSFWI